MNSSCCDVIFGYLTARDCRNILCVCVVRTTVTGVDAVEANFLMGRCSMFDNGQLTFDKYTWIIP